MSSQTVVFVPFRYCPICRLNHKKGKKHVHSKRHQDILAIVLSKFLKKISEAKEFLKKPAVQDLTWDQADKRFWCYFCQEDVKKHRQSTTTFGDCILEHGGMLEHITRSDHLDNTTKFLKENKLDLKRTAEFIISEKVYLTSQRRVEVNRSKHGYLQDVEAVYSHYFMQKIQTLKRVASQIRSQSMVRHDVMARSMQEKPYVPLGAMVIEDAAGYLVNVRNYKDCYGTWKGDVIQPQQAQKQQPYTAVRESNWQKSARDSFSSEERGKKTVQAFGDGLTVIDRLDEDDSVGNIYTNAVPPWMQPDDSSEASSGVIGPTVEDLEKHQKLERKRQLPACRVGAKFDRKSDPADTWLPDFGGVWNHGRRTKSGHQFLRRQSRGTKDGIRSSSTGRSFGQDSMPSSYSFPKISKVSATITGLTEQHNNESGIRHDTETSVASTDWQSSSNNSSYLGTPNAAQRSLDSFHNHNFGDVKSQSLNPSEVVTSTVHSSPSNLNASFVTVKPYVRKNRAVSAPIPEQSLSSESIYPPNILNHFPAVRFPVNTPDMFKAHNSTNYNKLPPHFLPEENHNSFLGYDRNKPINGVSYPVQNYSSSRSQPSFPNKVTNSQPFRLLATPVLNQEKSKSSPTRLHESVTFEK